MKISGLGKKKVYKGLSFNSIGFWKEVRYTGVYTELRHSV